MSRYLENLENPARAWFLACRKAEARVGQLEEALREIEATQPETLARLQSEGIVFDEKPHRDPSNWQQVAFWIYTDLCETNMLARAALAGGDSSEATA